MFGLVSAGSQTGSQTVAASHGWSQYERADLSCATDGSYRRQERKSRRALRCRQAIHYEQAMVQVRTMRQRSAWPTRYRITLQPVTGDPRDFLRQLAGQQQGSPVGT